MNDYINVVTLKVLNCCKVGHICTANIKGQRIKGTVLSCIRSGIDGLDYGWIRCELTKELHYVDMDNLEVVK